MVRTDEAMRWRTKWRLILGNVCLIGSC